MKIFLCLLTVILLASGCQTLGVSNEKIIRTADISVVKASKSHIIDVEVEQNLEGMFSGVHFYNILEGKNRYLLVSGSIRKPIGFSIDHKKINVRFLNDAGDVLSEKTDRISISRRRRPIGIKGKFSIKIPYDIKIKKCLIAFEEK